MCSKQSFCLQTRIEHRDDPILLLRNRPGHVAAIVAVLSADRCLVTLNPILPDQKLFADIAGLVTRRAPVFGGLVDALLRSAKAPQRQADTMVKEQREMEQMTAARVDPLTGIANRRAFLEKRRPAWVVDEE